MNKRMNGQKNEWIEEWMGKEWIDKRMNGWKNGRIEKCTNKKVNG